MAVLPLSNTTMISVTRTHPISSSNGGSGNFRVGLSLVKQGDGRTLVSRIHATSMFADSNLEPGQELLSVNGVKVRGLGAQETVRLLQQDKTVTVVVAKPPNRNSEEGIPHDDIDACQMGQFLLNPCWYVYRNIEQYFSKVPQERRNRGDPQVAKTLGVSKLQNFIYLTFFYAIWTVVFRKVIPLNQANQYLSRSHEVFTYILFFAAVGSWVLAKFSHPGSVTAQTIPKFDNYLYDGVLYQAGNVCHTLNIRKLARSKYDRYTNLHVPRYDHFCGWLGNTIGEENYRYFLVFLAVHSVMVLYGFGSLAFLLYRDAQVMKAGSILSHHPAIAATCIVCFLAAIPTNMFLFFHLSLIRKGMTTNEFYKWKQIIKENKCVYYSNDVEKLKATALVDVTMSRQFYNLGWGGNLHEALFPRSLRTNSLRLVASKEL